jgi:succinate dehydrogenase / fumarate reductase cytochrome b subunit
MATKSGMLNTSVAKKVAMALSGFFLMLFLMQHCTINMLSVISPDAFNETSHFMGTNALVQYLLQPILIFGVVFHLLMGMVLEQKNRASRAVKYAYSKPAASSSWMSRNMIITGIMVMLFLGLHFYDFWLPEVKTKFIDDDMSGMLADGSGFRYYEELTHKFVDPIRVAIYVVAFIFLSLHLIHGFQSAFQSVGFRKTNWTPMIQKLSMIYAVVIPTAFVFIAIYHHLAHH